MQETTNNELETNDHTNYMVYNINCDSINKRKKLQQNTLKSHSGPPFGGQTYDTNLLMKLQGHPRNQNARMKLVSNTCYVYFLFQKKKKSLVLWENKKKNVNLFGLKKCLR